MYTSAMLPLCSRPSEVDIAVQRSASYVKLSGGLLSSCVKCRRPPLSSCCAVRIASSQTTFMRAACLRLGSTAIKTRRIDSGR